MVDFNIRSEVEVFMRAARNALFRACHGHYKASKGATTIFSCTHRPTHTHTHTHDPILCGQQLLAYEQYATTNQVYQIFTTTAVAIGGGGGGGGGGERNEERENAPNTCV